MKLETLKLMLPDNMTVSYRNGTYKIGFRNNRKVAYYTTDSHDALKQAEKMYNEKYKGGTT